MTDIPWRSLPSLPDGALPWFVGGILAVVLIATLALRLATRLVAGFYPSWAQALAALICAQLASLLVCDSYRWALGISPSGQDFKGTVGVYCAGILSQIVIYSLVLREEGRNSISMIQAGVLNAPQIILLLCYISGAFGLSPKPPEVPESQKSVEEDPNHHPPASPVPMAPSAAAIADAQREALRRYPALGIAGSRMNTAFLERYRRYRKERPDYFRDAAWPVRLAEETAGELRTRTP